LACTHKINIHIINDPGVFIYSGIFLAIISYNKKTRAKSAGLILKGIKGRISLLFVQNKDGFYSPVHHLIYGIEIKKPVNNIVMMFNQT